MTYPPPLPRPPEADTPPDVSPPVDERPPYGEPGGRWRTTLWVGLVVAALFLLVALGRRLWRGLAALWLALRFEMPAERGVPVIVPDGRPYAGPVYRVRFFDGLHRQLADEDLSAAIDMHHPWARAQLAELAYELQRRAENRDGQRCWSPRVQLLDGAGKVVGEWP